MPRFVQSRRGRLGVVSIGASVIILLASIHAARADDGAPTTTQQAAEVELTEPSSTPELVHPAVPDDVQWAHRIVIAIGVLFAAALLAGVFIRTEAPEEMPPAHSHDEPPGRSHHHGASGTIDQSDPTAPRAAPDE
jgi:hypothetical protein